MGSQENQALLVAREQLLGWLIDVELSIRGILRGFGQKIGPVTCNGFEARIQELVICQATLELMVEAILSGSIKGGIRKAAQGCSRFVREDAVCRRLMTMPSVGPLVDDSNPARSQSPGALFGLLAGSRGPATRWYAQ